MKLIDAITGIARERKWAEEKKATIKLRNGHELTLADLDSDNWSIKTVVDNPELAEAVSGLVKHLKDNDAVSIDTEGNVGKLQ